MLDDDGMPIANLKRVLKRGDVSPLRRSGENNSHDQGGGGGGSGRHPAANNPKPREHPREHPRGHPRDHPRDDPGESPGDDPNSRANPRVRAPNPRWLGARQRGACSPDPGP